MKKTTLADKSKIYCISNIEAQMLYEHIEGYLTESISIKPGDTIIDIGANIGVFGIVLSKKFNNNINIYSFEPIPDIYQILQKNTVLSNNKNFLAYGWGISDNDESVNITFYPNSPALSTSYPEIWNNENDLIQAIEGNLNNAPKNWWWSKYIPKFSYRYIMKRLRRKSKIVNCQLKTLESTIKECNIKSIDLLKIDCEGNELKVVHGISNDNWEIIKQLVIEVHDEDNRLDYIKKLLVTKGYKVSINQEPALEGTKLFNIYATSM